MESVGEDIFSVSSYFFYEKLMIQLVFDVKSKGWNNQW